MWRIGDLTDEYRNRMYNIIDLYSLEYDKRNPVICIDEKSKRILVNSPNKPPIHMVPVSLEKIDYEYVLNVTCYFFVDVEPKGGKHFIKVTNRRTKSDFITFVEHIV
jgi:hypothetical protein